MEAPVGLKIELKPGERVMLGDCVITNHDQRTRLLIDGHAPILREKDILTAKTADSPCKRIYLAVQLMYTSRNPTAYHEHYFALVRDITQAAPSMWPLIESINNQILTGELWLTKFLDTTERRGNALSDRPEIHNSAVTLVALFAPY